MQRYSAGQGCPKGPSAHFVRYFHYNLHEYYYPNPKYPLIEYLHPLGLVIFGLDGGGLGDGQFGVASALRVWGTKELRSRISQ